MRRTFKSSTALVASMSLILPSMPFTAAAQEAPVVLICPDGTALPCHAAKVLPGIEFPTVRNTSVRDLWLHSPVFNRFRGEAWMPEPCRSCPEKSRDLGGCRCQAFLLTGDPNAADPICDKSPLHGRVLEIIRHPPSAEPARPLEFRSAENSGRLATADSGS